MPGNNFVRDASQLQVQLISIILKMARMDIPVVAVWFNENKSQVQGTKHLKNMISNIEKVEVENAIKLDFLNLVSPETNESLLETDVNPEQNQAKSMFQNICQKQKPDFLPFPLSCMNKREKISWVTGEILREQQIKSGAVFGHVKYGDQDLIPSFWPNDEWEWKNLTKNLSNVSNNSYTGQGNLQNFITELITRCLTAKGKDPETYVVANIDKKKINRRKKSHRIHEELHIVEDADDIIDETDANAQGEDVDIQESTYRDPFDSSHPESSTFVPRRNLPDSMPYRCPEDGETSVGPELDSAECGPLPPGATPVNDDEVQPPEQQSYTYMESDHAYPSQLVEPNLSESDFESGDIDRWISDPPGFLQDIPEPLHPGWKAIDNSGGGPCLFKATSDHIRLKDFRHLRRYTHSHIIDQWYFFKPFYTFPLLIKIGSGNGSHTVTIPDEMIFLAFLRSEKSMIAWNTSQAEVIALGEITMFKQYEINLNHYFRTCFEC